MNKLQQLNKILELQETLENLGYHFMTTKHDYELEHHDFLVTDQWNNGVIFGGLSFNENGNFMIYRAVILGLPSQFVKVHNLIEKDFK